MSESREVINFIFQNLVFFNVGIKNNIQMYACRLPTSFSNGKRCFVLAFVTSPTRDVARARLSDLHWKAVATRTLGEDEITDDYLRLVEQKWEIPPPSTGVNLPMTLVERADRTTKYKLADETEVLLLHDIEKNTRFQYSGTMRLIQALLTMKCIVTPYEPRAPPPQHIQWL